MASIFAIVNEALIKRGDKMDGLISLIIFFIISSIFSSKKNEKKKSIKQKNNQNTDETASNNSQWMEDIWNEMKTGPAKDLISMDKVESLAKKAKSLKSKSIEAEEKNFESKKNKSNTQTLYKKDNVNYDISAESNEGKSLNSDYVLRSDTSSIASSETAKRKRKKDLFRNQDDLKRAVIMKEIIDRPLSMRNLRKF
ncbi:MAG: hypothetical protein PWR23_174 [Peptostreptococcaceae bacterium]|nr:hypothetical protein [Peptostreptococcaceae bacterium]